MEIAEHLSTQYLAPRGPFTTRVSIVRRHPMAALAAVILVVFAAVGALAPVLAPHDPAAADGRKRLHTPTWEHPFGTDALGRDVLSREMYGARVSLQVAALAVLFTAAIGVPLGLVSGYYGGVVDTLIMRTADAVIAFPGLVLALALVLVLGPSILTLMLALGIGAWPTYARLVRSQVLAIKNMEFVTAARALGAADVRIIVRHIWPNTIPSVIVAGTLTMGMAILAEASLSFLGIGIRPPTPTWGGMLNDAFRQIYVAPWLSVFPGAAIFVVTLSFNLLGDGLRDALDPRLRRSGGP